MIVTSMLSIDIVRYLNDRTEATPYRRTTLGEVADQIYGPEDLVFGQAVDLARCRGWVIVEGNSPSRRVCLTKAGCSLVLSPTTAPNISARAQVAGLRRSYHSISPAH
jgi:hypothetical protein